MANGDFLSGLSSGIFGRLGELRKEQEGKDTQRKQDTINLLSSLTDKVEPESLPMLMGHLGDVIGIKGKMRGFWDAFSGMPNRSMEDQLGTKLKDVMSGTVGSGTARTLRDADKQKWMQREGLMSGGVPDERNYQGSTPIGLQNKLIFRDPRSERLEELTTKYESQANLLNTRLTRSEEARTKSQEDAQRHQIDLQDIRYGLKAQEEIKKRMAFGLTEKQAKSQIANEYGLKTEQLEAYISKLKAETTKANIEAQTLQETGGLTPGQVQTENRFQQTQQTDIQKLIAQQQANILGLKGGMNAKAIQIEDMLKKITQNPNLRFNRETGAITSIKPITQEESGMLESFLKNNAPMTSLRNEYTKLIEDLQKSTSLKSSYEVMLNGEPTSPQTPSKPKSGEVGSIGKWTISKSKGIKNVGETHTLDDGRQVKILKWLGVDSKNDPIYQVEMIRN